MAGPVACGTPSVPAPPSPADRRKRDFPFLSGTRNGAEGKRLEPAVIYSGVQHGLLVEEALDVENEGGFGITEEGFELFRSEFGVFPVGNSQDNGIEVVELGKRDEFLTVDFFCFLGIGLRVS